MMAIRAALTARGEQRSVVLVPESAHGTNPATAALLGYRTESVPAREDGTVDLAEVEETPLGRCRSHHAHESEHLRAVRARCGGDCRGGARGRRVRLCGWRELQRHRRQGAARRPRRRRHAHQPAQDLLDAAWRRRAGRGAGGVFRGACALRAVSIPGARQGRPASRVTAAFSRASTSRSAACAHSTARWACSCAP